MTKYYRVNGAEVSLAQAARDSGLHPNTLRSRMQDGGLDLESALELGVKHASHLKMYRGKLCAIAEIVKDSKLTWDTIKWRMNEHALNIDEAVDYKPNYRNANVHTVHGQEMTVKLAGELYGVDYLKLSNKMNRKDKCTLEEAVDWIIAKRDGV